MSTAKPIETEHTQGFFICLACVLIGFGTLMVHSASITSWPTEYERVYLQKHLSFLIIGVFAATVSSRLSPSVWYRLAWPLYGITVLLLIAVLIPGVGTRVNGAQRWLRYGSISLQPSELAKIALPLLIARQLSQRRGQLKRWISGTIPFLVPVAIVVGLVVREPDLGTGLFLVAVAGLTLFLGGWPLRHFVLTGLLVGPAAVVGVGLRPYQLERIQGLLSTWKDVNSAPYQLRQSLLTLGSGGTTGIGLGRGWQKLSFLPEANTDFVFSVVGEELGLIGTVGLIAVWILLFLTGIMLVRRIPRGSFASTVSLALLTQLTLQAAINIAVVTALVPPKGIPHPFLSYGGNSLVMSLVALGIILSMARGEHSGTEPDAC